VPHLRIWHRRSTTHLISLERRWSPAAEAYRALRTSIMFSAAVEGSKVIMVTSSGQGEGKTTTAANLSVVLAEAGKRVIIVSADLRKPRLAKFFHMATERDKGVTNVVSGEVELDDALQTTSVENLLLLGSGPIPGRPTDMLFSAAFAELIASLKSRADFVILDTTPLLLVADALTLSKLADTILFVADSSSTSRAAVASCRKELARAHTPVMGAVMNNFQTSKTVEYGTYSLRRYRYGYRQRRLLGEGLDGNGSGPPKATSTNEGADPVTMTGAGSERSKNDPA
jgi:capsular exopolysaccharide synthesis family protein